MRLRLSLVLAAVILPAHPGSAGDGALALQSAAPSCRNDSPAIYVDCGNGTVTDNRTGLVWLADASCFEAMDWLGAVRTVAGLGDLDQDFCDLFGLTPAECDCGLSDGSAPGEWRLPTISEWRTMTADALGQPGDPDCKLSPPAITNDSGQGCWVSGPTSFSGVVADFYWSSSTVPADGAREGWGVDLTDAYVGSGDKSINLILVWPVRGGQ